MLANRFQLSTSVPSRRMLAFKCVASHGVVVRRGFVSQQQATPVAWTSSSRQARLTVSCSATEASKLPGVPSTDNGKLISKTEVAAFIQRDDMMDQMHRWALIEAAEAGYRNFGLPMTVEPFYNMVDDREQIWGFKVGIFREGVKLTDLAIKFDTENVNKHEWVGRGDDGFPIMEGKVQDIYGKHFEIWKLDTIPVDEQLRSAIRGFCTGLVTAMNRYYAFGSVFVDDAQ